MFTKIGDKIFNLAHIVSITGYNLYTIFTADGKYSQVTLTATQYENLLNNLKEYNFYLQQEKREYKAPINLL